LTDSLMMVSHTRIRDALYNAGKIYKSEFSNYQRSAEAFEELLVRYPEYEYQLSAWYDLYYLYEMMGETLQAEKYKKLIVSEYPESNFAQYLVNPDFFVEVESRRDKLNQLYEQTFQSYRSGNYQNVLALSDELKTMKPDSQLVSKI